MAKEKVAAEMDRLAAARDVALRQMLRWKVRYFTDVTSAFHPLLHRCGRMGEMHPIGL
jgi:hypothetical protein